MIFVFLFFAFGLQQKSNLAYLNTQQNQLHSEENDHQILIEDFFEFILTGHFEHTHSHHDSDAESEHEHPHQHSSMASVAFMDFMPAVFQFHYESLKLSWPVDIELNLKKSFQSELLRPPIYS